MGTGQRTEGFNVYNYSAENLVFTSVSGSVQAPSSKRLLPGQKANFEIPWTPGSASGYAHFNAVSADGFVLSTVNVHMGFTTNGFTMTTDFDSPKFFTYVPGADHNQTSNTIEDAASSPLAKQDYVAGSDAEQAALRDVCVANVADCTFTPEAPPTYVGFKRLLTDAFNSDDGPSPAPTTLTTNNGYSATTTDTWGEQVTASGDLGKIVNIGVTASHESSVAFTHDFSTSYSMAVTPGYTGYIYAYIPSVVTTGTFLVHLGNTTWTMPGVSITSPDPNGNANRYTSEQHKGDHPFGTIHHR